MAAEDPRAGRLWSILRAYDTAPAEVLSASVALLVATQLALPWSTFGSNQNFAGLREIGNVIWPSQAEAVWAALILLAAVSKMVGVVYAIKPLRLTASLALVGFWVVMAFVLARANPPGLAGPVFLGLALQSLWISVRMGGLR